jgi:hypothetical protein
MAKSQILVPPRHCITLNAKLIGDNEKNSEINLCRKEVIYVNDVAIMTRLGTNEDAARALG